MSRGADGRAGGEQLGDTRAMPPALARRAGKRRPGLPGAAGAGAPRRPRPKSRRRRQQQRSPGQAPPPRPAPRVALRPAPRPAGASRARPRPPESPDEADPAAAGDAAAVTGDAPR